MPEYVFQLTSEAAQIIDIDAMKQACAHDDIKKINDDIFIDFTGNLDFRVLTLAAEYLGEAVLTEGWSSV